MQTVVGLTNAELAGIARVPESPETHPLPERRSETFWTASPGPVEKREPAPPVNEIPLQGVPLDDDVTLLIRAARPLESDDIEALRAAAPLLKLLETRHLH